LAIVEPDCNSGVVGGLARTGIRAGNGREQGERLMKQLIGALTAVVLLVAAGVAQAQTWRGTLEAVDEEAGTFTVLGMEFIAGEHIEPKLDGIGLGQDVVVEFEELDGENVATYPRLATD
jgi:hypothetical protein